MVLLVVLHDDRCAILRNNELIYQTGGDADSIDGAVQRFMAMTQVSDVLSGDESEPAGAGHDDGDGDSGRAARAEMTRMEQPGASATSSNTPPAAGTTPPSRSAV